MRTAGRGSKSITMKDVAARAGVSVSTVSHVINETRFVERKTKYLIRKAIKELNYKPNIIARSLKGKGTETIGTVISDIRDTFFADAIKSIESSANRGGFNVILCDAEGNIKKENAYIDMLLRKGVDGLIIAPVDINGLGIEVHPKTIPVVQIDRKMNGFDADFIGIDNEKSAERAVAHLIDHGYKNIGYIGYENRFYTMQKRFEGYKRAIENEGHKVQSLITTRSHNGVVIKKEIKSWLKNNVVDAVLCGNDDVCFETMAAVNELGLKIPDDLALLTFDDVKWFRFLNCPVTAIRQPSEEIGKLAVERLIRRISGKNNLNSRDFFLDTELIVRDSCGAHQGYS
jgi:LacI family transcriptional regulator